jgi:hypothetical protein
LSVDLCAIRNSVYCDSAVPHTGKSVGQKKAKLLAVMFNYQ